MAGIFATAANLAVLAFLVQVAHLTPRMANVPGLLAGAIVNFIGNRDFAFRAQSGNISRQFKQFMLVEIVAFALNTYIFDAVLVLWPVTTSWYLVVRLVTSGVVYLGWSYPLWHRVFSKKDRAPAPASSRDPERDTQQGGRVRVADGNGDVQKAHREAQEEEQQQAEQQQERHAHPR